MGRLWIFFNCPFSRSLGLSCTLPGHQGAASPGPLYTILRLIHSNCLWPDVSTLVTPDLCRRDRAERPGSSGLLLRSPQETHRELEGLSTKPMRRLTSQWLTTSLAIPRQRHQLLELLLSCSVLSDSVTLWAVGGFSVQEILQVRILEWVAIPFSTGSS